jgi:putative addiction module killer protein
VEPLEQTERFRNWFENLRDEGARLRILARIRRVAVGNYSDSRRLKRGVVELRIAYGPGYRLYIGRLSERGNILLVGGTKKTQQWDIRTAYLLMEDL